jgi:hypothetical protein
MARTDQTCRSPFFEYEPVYWHPQHGGAACAQDVICSVKRNHGVRGSYRLHNPRDEINGGRHLLDRVLIEYRIGANRYDLFTVGDLFRSSYAFDPKAAGNIMGDIAERIARRITKYFLRHFSPGGRPGGIFDKRFDPKNRDDFVVANTAQYILKIQRYPNLVILKRTGKGKYGYENVKELDGLFDYRSNDERHILVLESKLDRIGVDCVELIENLFRPLRALMPEARLSYVLFSNQESIFVKKDLHRYRRLKDIPRRIHEALKTEGIGFLLFTFNEMSSDFERMKNHLITQYRSVGHLGVEIRGKMLVSDRSITLFDEGETPHLKLVKDRKSGLWKEVKLTHKRSVLAG